MAIDGQATSCQSAPSRFTWRSSLSSLESSIRNDSREEDIGEGWYGKYEDHRNKE